MTKKKSKSIAALFLILLLSIAAISVYAASEGSVKNIVRTQGVDIRVSAKVDESLVSPGKEVSYTPVVENRGADSWIRFKFMENKCVDEYLGLSSDWVQRGGYWYLTKPVLSKESVPTVHSFKVAEDLTDQNIQSFSIEATYDAIQSENFTPDFDSENPWGSISIIKSDFDGTNYVRSIASVEPLTVDIGDSSDVVITSEDILDYNISPGDIKSNTLVIENSSKTDKKVNFKAISDRSNRLLQNVYIGIGDSNGEIYDGALSEANFDKEVATIPAGEKAIINYEISIPTSVDNELQGEKGEFEWHFMTDDVKSISQSQEVKTNDTFPVGMVFGIMAAAAICIVAVLKFRRRNEK